MNKTSLNLWSAFIGEAKANRTYIAYGVKALEEGHPEVAQIFFEIAGAETIHAIQHLKAAGAVKSTLENLRQVVEEEQYESKDMYPRFIKAAQEENRPDAVASFELAGEREGHHMKMFTEALAGLEKKIGVHGKKAAPVPEPVGTPPLSEESKAVKDGVDGELKNEKKRIIKLERIREIVFGMQDGIVSTAAVAASVMASTRRVGPTLVAAFASGLAGMISMSAGSFLGSKAQRDLHLGEIKKEALEIKEKPEEELAELIEIYRQEGLSREQAEKMALKLSEDKDLFLRTLAEKELGISVESTEERAPWKDAIAMGIAFIIGSILAVLPYMLFGPGQSIPVSMVTTVAYLLLLGMIKGRVTKSNVLISSLEVAGIGLAAALIGYALGRLMPSGA
ncbi:MAG: VIT1/CCC1 transporter family protein [Elusimicrobia bacterium]|nr:VIT1/CCC1 transporter family protein [Candidatus Obscuribacterium magneticum]